MPDKFSAVWISHSSLCDFLQCPRAYYLKNVYKDPQTNHKMQLMTPHLALGAAVHEVIEALSKIKTAHRFNTSLIETFSQAWKKYSGEKGGFTSQDQEKSYKIKGEAMLNRVINHPGPLKNQAVKIKGETPFYWLSEDDGIILCGKVDWLEYLPDSDSVHIIDFKTGKNQEDPESLQLPIYHLLVHNTQHRKVAKASYWYLAFADQPEEKELPNLIEAHEEVLSHAKQVKLARKLNIFKCTKGEKGCYSCKPFERVLVGEGKKVGLSQFNQDIYILPANDIGNKFESEIL